MKNSSIKQQMLGMILDGKTYREVGEHFGITKQAVHQHVKAYIQQTKLLLKTQDLKERICLKKLKFLIEAFKDKEIEKLITKYRKNQQENGAIKQRNRKLCSLIADIYSLCDEHIINQKNEYSTILPKQIIQHIKNVRKEYRNGH